MKTVRYMVKLVLAGIVALAILCAVASIYSLSPMRVENKHENTDYIWESEKPWMKMTEGISCGVIDKNGFNNLDVVDNPDVLFLGSSHIEGMNVQQNDHSVSLLNEEFKGEMTFYNMGISGHTLFKVVQYLEQSMKVFETVPKYVVIETSTTVLTPQEVYGALNEEVSVTTVNNDGIVAKLQRLPFLRQVYHQLDSGMMDMLLPKPVNNQVVNVDVNVQTEEVVIDEQPYEDMFEYLNMVEEKYSTEIVILYHPFEKINKDGSIAFDFTEYTDLFSDYSDKHEIGFVDMTDEFTRMYYEENHVAHGFSTGELCAGHINKYGHKAIAHSLGAYLSEAKEGK